MGIDYWDPHPARGAWVRVHLGERRKLHTPEESKGGPFLADLQDTCVTHMHFRDGAVDVLRDSWREPRPEARVGRDLWIGFTCFLAKGSDAEVVLPKRRIRPKGPPAVDDDWGGVITRVETSAGLDRTALVASLTVAGIERVRLGAA